MYLDLSQRVELGIDGNCGYALLGVNLQEGEAEFVEIPSTKHMEEAKVWACKEALKNLRKRLGMPNLSYYFSPSHPYWD